MTTTSKKKVGTKKKVTKKKVTTKKVEVTGIPEGAVSVSHGKGRYMMELPLSVIQVDEKTNPRNDRGDIGVLAAEIKRDGLLHNIVVRPHTTQAGKFQIIAGDRRYAAIKSLEWATIPVLVRPDLKGDEAATLALAVAENSEDGRVNLNTVEIGRAAKVLRDKYDWKPAKIAQQVCLHPAKIRRALTIVDGPRDVIEKVELGELTAKAALELVKLTPANRAKVAESLEPNPTVADIREATKKVTTGQGRTKPGKRNNNAKGDSRDAALVVRKSNTVKNKMLASLCYDIVKAPKEAAGSEELYNIRGAVAALLWERGEFDSVEAPTCRHQVDPFTEPARKPDSATYKARVLSFDACVQAYAAKFDESQLEDA